MKRQYNKLVRDKIPDVIRQNGEEPVTRILTNDEYKHELDKKLLEEVKEYLESDTIEELTDIAEVLRAIVLYKGTNMEQFEIERLDKAYSRGAFEQKIFLEGIAKK